MKIFCLPKLTVILSQLQELRDEYEQKRTSVLLVSSGEAARVQDATKFGVVIAWMKDTVAFCKDLGLENAESKIELIVSHYESFPGSVDCSTVAADLRNAEESLMLELWPRKFVEIPKDYTEYLDNESLLGLNVRSAFKSAAPDIVEAGNCIAIDCGTAAVFHLMRVAEWGLRALCVHLKVLRIPKSKKPGEKRYTPLEYSQWERILTEAREAIEKKIGKMRAGPVRQEAQEFYYSLLQDLNGFKDAWRNHVMHTRATYTRKGAEDVYDHVKRFMALLATKVSE
jgi:hypothetical protein